jgi:hypothetical protein
MALSEEQRKKIIKENEKWITGWSQPDFGPDYSSPIAEDIPSLQGDKDGFNRVDIGGLPNEIRSYVKGTKPIPSDVLDELVDQTGDENLAYDLLDRKGTQIAELFIKRNPKYVRSDENYRQLVETLCFNFALDLESYIDEDISGVVHELVKRQIFTVQNLTDAFQALYDSGGLSEYPEGDLKPITQRQLQQCQILATHNIQEATKAYIRYRVGADVFDAMTAKERDELVVNPEYRPLLVETAFFLFQQLHPEVLLSQELIDYMSPYLEGKWASAKLIEKLYEQFLREKKEDRLFNVGSQPLQNPIDLENLSDDEINNLRKKTLAEYRKQNRHRTGGIIE